MRRLLYVSVAKKPISLQDQMAILDGARKNNSRHGVTGVLLQKDSTFLQLLEGAPEVLSFVYKDIILRDARHHHATVLFDRQASGSYRLFHDWRMGFFHLNSVESALGRGVLRNEDQQFFKLLRENGKDDLIAQLLLEFWAANSGGLCPSQSTEVAACV